MHETAPARRLLMIDPDEACQHLIPILQAAGWTVESSTLDTDPVDDYDVGLIHLKATHFEHLDTLEKRITRNTTRWVALLTANDLRRERIGDFVCQWFFDFQTVPLDAERMQATLDKAFDSALSNTQSRGPAPQGEPEMLGDSRLTRELRRLLSKLAPTESPVLIRGERGTGKALIARSLHAQSRRRDKPFVAVDCAAVAEHLIDAELFGHEAGAVDGLPERRIGRIESADGGTLLLENIGDLPLETQADLLRFLEDGQLQHLGSSEPVSVDVRVLAATEADLETAIRKKRFREDLYYRLNVLQVGTAPLRERHGDLALLANHFAHLYSQESGRRARSFSQDALIALGKHDWPGNVSELANRVRRGLVLAEGRQIEAVNLGLPGDDDVAGSMSTLEEYKSRAERQALCDVLTRHSDNLSMAAKVLGISRPTFYRLLHKHQIR
ncbi:DNA-binding transcriptional response regulator, NtrC family, contains REC, AAA-type ATPase, and a Fis-type DNA-binding domains [Pseudomonas syringae]|uniref:sigma-54-dependent transcriptional regulator n=1 Tax=Pseudomonas syringae TaxID=317 RepID=UPI00089D30E2|nr:sigma-54 dependent transcriptional regulator [Pseudomonas syringae]SDW59286.1 DNA-binding transcriptional response regulator, NtrC family, contains REC, AAA-type ATPase, and a Fis-type DNA-binding domains [Pseudomonas syringae]SFL83155.1 DNA-binding transcriptional response regulator, NtrC family, contains REC, AAA-type ATPase, and a Fis-type DNA-binding domains [Pseudomonas syringae]